MCRSPWMSRSAGIQHVRGDLLTTFSYLHSWSNTTHLSDMAVTVSQYKSRHQHWNSCPAMTICPVMLNVKSFFFYLEFSLNPPTRCIQSTPSSRSNGSTKLHTLLFKHPSPPPPLCSEIQSVHSQRPASYQAGCTRDVECLLRFLKQLMAFQTAWFYRHTQWWWGEAAGRSVTPSSKLERRHCPFNTKPLITLGCSFVNCK